MTTYHGVVGYNCLVIVVLSWLAKRGRKDEEKNESRST